MELIAPTETVLYTIEQAIKEYRKFSQINISKITDGITVDQALTLILIDKNPDLNQKELSNLIFKDYASITRIIELMVKKEYLKRTINKNDRRRFNLNITTKGRDTINALTPTIEHNRNTALNGLTASQILELQNTLQLIISNCSKQQ